MPETEEDLEKKEDIATGDYLFVPKEVLMRLQASQLKNIGKRKSASSQDLSTS